MDNKFFTSGDMDDLVFFQVPKVLILGKKYKTMKPNSLKLYMVLLDRMKLSLLNGWKNEKNYYYVRMSQEGASELFQWSPTTFRSMKKELEKYDLLVQEREGQGKSNRLYIKKCEFTEEDIYKINKAVDVEFEGEENKAQIIDDNQKNNFCSSADMTEKDNSWPSRRTEVDLLEEQKLTTNNNYFNNNNLNNNELNNSVNKTVNKDNSSQRDTISKLTTEYLNKGLSDELIHRVVQEALDKKMSTNIINFGGYLRTCLETTLERVELKNGERERKFESYLFKDLM